MGLATVPLWGGLLALVPGTFSVAGTVNGSSGPAAGATIVAKGENGFSRTVFSNALGRFAISGLPSGGAALNVTDPGYSPTLVVVLDSKVYVGAGGSPQAMQIQLFPGNATGPPNVVSETLFPNLETLVANLWSVTVLWILAGVVVVLGTRSFGRTGRGTRGVVAGATAAGAAVLPPFFGVLAVYPLLGYGEVTIGILGGVALLLVVIPMAFYGRPPDYGPLGG